MEERIMYVRYSMSMHLSISVLVGCVACGVRTGSKLRRRQGRHQVTRADGIRQKRILEALLLILLAA